jgi:hypothetical protein
MAPGRRIDARQTGNVSKIQTIMFTCSKPQVNNEFDVAIVGMSCRFPGAPNVEEFWRNLAACVESIARLSDEEILESGVPHAYLGNPNYVKAAPVLDGPGHFDAAFFGLSPMEARSMDPQQRILLELAWAALEDAGYDTCNYQGRIGVFTGSAMNTYFINSGLNGRFAEEYIPTLIGNDKDFLSTRISYKLNLKGPSLCLEREMTPTKAKMYRSKLQTRLSHGSFRILSVPSKSRSSNRLTVMDMWSRFAPPRPSTVC